MLGSGDLSQRFTFSLRFVDTDADRARWRVTADYNVTPRLKLGLEYNPAVSELGFRGTWEAVHETADAPMVVLGTSSDRIGTPKGYQGYYVTVGKGISGTDAGVYGSIHYSEFEQRLIFPFGASYEISPSIGLLMMNDGRHSHALATFRGSDYSLSMMWLWLKRPGISIAWGF